MANISLTRVNQKLAQARVLLTGVDEEQLTPVQQNSLQEAAAFHLVCAYQHYLREIAESYGLKNTAAIRSEADLTAAFYAAKKQPVEANELLALRDNANSWVQQLHSYYQGLWLPPKVATAVEATEEEEGSNIIAAVNIDPSIAVAPVDIALILSWHADFVALARRQRETSAEF